MNGELTGALVSIHDVMPETLAGVETLIELVRDAGLGPASLLVVPGRDWDAAAIARLRAHADRGHELVGHGWLHRVERIRGFRHRLHSLLVSRDVAEHLELDADGIRALIRRCRDWFDDHALPAPSLYVPPAWAMGKIARRQLHGLGFRWFETLGGIYDAESDRMQRLPVVGFEADTPLRAALLRASNAWNRRQGRQLGALRIALHPRDLELRLAPALMAQLRNPHPARPCPASP